MHHNLFRLVFLAVFSGIIPQVQAQNQTIQDDFEGNGTIQGWSGDDCQAQPAYSNPFPGGINSSSKVLRYHDTGGQYANIRFDIQTQYNLAQFHTFRFKIYVPSAGITGNQPNQVSLKLQNGTVERPWETQSEIIKPIVLNQWQELSFNFQQDNWINLDPSSVPPTQRADFSRVLIQVNGENNTSQVLAYIDDFAYDGTIPIDPEFSQLVWEDEFSSDGAVDAGKWFHQTKLPAGGSWFNGELQHYTNRLANSFQSNGVLKITAKRENFTDQGHTKAFTSARLNSKFAFTYGRIEFRAKIPAGAGTWPALWTLGKNINEQGAYWQTQGFGNTGWPACGEIDVMEHWGVNPNFVQSATHTPSSFGSTINKGGRILASALSDFHVYSLDWYVDRLVFKIDNTVHYVYKPAEKNASTWPFDADQYLVMNVAIEPSISPAFNQAAMEIDYVRIYQGAPTSVSTLKEKGPVVFYPNPANSQIRFELDESLKGSCRVELFRPDGIRIKPLKQKINGKLLELEGLESIPKGVYYGILIQENERRHFRFIRD
jgi:beta-glucanase (GH16 family)